MYLLKKIISQLFMPISVIIILIILGITFLHKNSTGKKIIFISIFLLYILSLQPVSELFLSPLEHYYPPFTKKMLEQNPNIKYIVVLAAGHVTDKNIPFTSQINSSSLIRVIEGVRIAKLYPNAKLILSGGITFDPVPEAESLNKIALLCGLDQSRIILEENSIDTETQADEINKIVKNNKFILVTSAYHMLRTVLLFKKKKMKIIPAPIGFSVRKLNHTSPSRFFPRAVSLQNIEKTIHEVLGIVWSKLRGKI